MIKIITDFSRTDYPISTGKELSRNIFTWDKLNKYISIDNYGKTKESGKPSYYLFLHELILKKDGNMIGVFEQYKNPKIIFTTDFNARKVKIGDIILVEFDKNMNPIEFKKIEKRIVRYSYTNLTSSYEIKNSQLFEYNGYQNLGDDKFLFFYYNKQRIEGKGRKRYVLGINSYINHKISEQKIPFKTEEGNNLIVSPAKNGYIMISEHFKDKEKSSELRIEKINY